MQPEPRGLVEPEREVRTLPRLPRCAFAEEVCARVSPALDDIAGGHQVACHMMVPGSGHSRAGTICAGHD